VGRRVGAVLLSVRFQRPPVTPDSEISTIRRCLSSQCTVYVVLLMGSLRRTQYSSNRFHEP
jgi:hypothetical protein